jgi:hypothetical protein
MSLSAIRGSDLRTLELLIHDRAHTCTVLLASPREILFHLYRELVFLVRNILLG